MNIERTPALLDDEVRWLRICIQLGQLQRDYRRYKQVVRSNGSWHEPSSRQIQEPARYFD